MGKIIRFRPKPGAVVTVRVVVEYPQGVKEPPKVTPLLDRLAQKR